MLDHVPCRGCELARSKDAIQMRGGWALTHYLGDEGYLGWMAIAPVAHRMSIASLSDVEAFEFMRNVQTVEAAIQSYWTEDKIERFYFIYYAESLATHPFHFHVHLIPRFKSIKTKAWDMYKASKQYDFPEKYQKTPDRINGLMAYLRKHLEEKI